MRAPRRALGLALLVCLLPLWPVVAQDEPAEALTQQLLTTPFPEALLVWNGGVTGPYLPEDLFSGNAEGFFATVEIDTGGGTASNAVAFSTISYDIYREPEQAHQAYAAWKTDTPEWLSERQVLTGEPFLTEAYLQADVASPEPSAVCASVVGNVVAFSLIFANADIPTDTLYAYTIGNCEAAVVHLRSVL